jgi:hypothetical protein
MRTDSTRFEPDIFFDVLGKLLVWFPAGIGERPERFSTPKKEREREPNPLSVLHTKKLDSQLARRRCDGDHDSSLRRRRSYMKQNFWIMVSVCMPALRAPFNWPTPFFLLVLRTLLKAAK